MGTPYNEWFDRFWGSKPPYERSLLTYEGFDDDDLRVAFEAGAESTKRIREALEQLLAMAEPMSTWPVEEHRESGGDHQCLLLQDYLAIRRLRDAVEQAHEALKPSDGEE